MPPNRSTSSSKMPWHRSHARSHPRGSTPWSETALTVKIHTKTGSAQLQYLDAWTFPRLNHGCMCETSARRSRTGQALTTLRFLHLVRTKIIFTITPPAIPSSTRQCSRGHTKKSCHAMICAITSCRAARRLWDSDVRSLVRWGSITVMDRDLTGRSSSKVSLRATIQVLRMI